ncbi:tetratricopeptide repeat protein [Labrys okinawensis]|uniref:tetratricopeptide repeat protein n=1 Tax=Labrys okinawensis TaxID=346911 RepID=UPI0039BD2E2E
MRRLWLTLIFVSAVIASQPAWADDSSVCAGSNDDLAIPACGRVIAKKSTSRAGRAQAYYNRAISYANKGKSDLAIQDYSQAIALDPNYASAYNNRCSAYSKTGKFDEAIADCDRAIELKSDYDLAYYNRGNVYRKKNMPDRAIADITKAISIKATDPDYFFYRAMAYQNNDQIDLAIKDYDKAIELNPDYGNAYYNRGNIYRKHNNPDQAIADFTKALAIDSSDADTFFFRGLTYQNNNQLDEAIADYDKALELTPNDFDTLFNRGLARKKTGDFDLAIADYDKALTVKADAGAYNSRGNAYYSKGDPARAIADYTSAIGLDSNDADAYYNRGTTFTDQGDYNSAVADLDKVVTLQPNNASGFTARANAYRKKGEIEKAIADYRSALALAPDDADVKKGLADAIGAQPPAGADGSNLSADSGASKEAATATGAGGPKSAESNAIAQPTLRRVALVIGNSGYRAVAHLPNPASDAQLVGDALRQAGVDVTVALDLDRAGMVSALRAFSRKADNSDWAVIYYAGHGMELDGTNYLIPIDATLETDRDVPDEALSLDRVLSAVDGARLLKLVILDACRNNPFAQQMKLTVAKRAVTRGLSRIEPADATMVVYSAKEGTTAEDGDGANSVFAASISKRIVEPGVEINKVFRLVTRDVLTETGNRQQPFVYGSLPPDDFILVPAK